VPAGTSNETSSTASTPPNALRKPLTASASSVCERIVR
jgi:hypothetical protein